MKVFKSVSLIGNCLYLETADKEVEVSERKKKTGTVGSIWSESFAEMAGKQGEWITDGKKLRAGVSALIEAPDGVVLNRFDSGHPTAPNKLSTPAGIWEGKESLFGAALRELGEEVILVDGNKCGQWLFATETLSNEWVKEYAESHMMKMSGFRVEVYEHEAEGTVSVYLDDDYQGEALLAYEPETGGVELIFVFQCDILLNGLLRDGERFGEKWLDREVGLYDWLELHNEPDDRKTTKVKVVEAYLQEV